MQAKVIVLGAGRAVDSLTYCVPPEMEDRIQPGHRVLVPVRSRRLTGIVVELGDRIEAGGAALKPIAELLEPTPLFDCAHLKLLEFVASYYLVSPADAWRSVMPAVARVESRRMLKLLRLPAALELAAMNPLERSIVEALSIRPMTERELKRLGSERAIAGALRQLSADVIVAPHEATRGRHREPSTLAVRLGPVPSSAALRGKRQRQIVALLSQLRGGTIALAALEAQVPGARLALDALVKRGLVETSEQAIESAVQTDAAAPEPNEEQAAAMRAVAPAIAEPRAETFLLWGVTASGKTEVYIQLAARCLTAGRQVLVMVPEIALADQVVRAFRARFGETVAVAHSGQNLSERWASWRAALSGRARIMIGPRSAIFAPLHELGLIVVDEEHDPAYKSEEGIRYNARDLAVALGGYSRCPVVLGSATPSAESYRNAQRRRYRMLHLARRVQDRPLAAVEVIDLREEFRKEHANGAGTSPPAADRASDKPPEVPLSERLVAALKENLAAGGQSVVFLNRRGYHNFLQCQLCGNVIVCPNCSVAMTFHLRDRSLRCHYCDHRAPAPDRCPGCGGFGLVGQGFGTERLVAALSERIPQARIERMDSDTSGRRGARIAIVEALARGEIDIIVGTQMITKGFDLPGVTLVGVVLADLALNLPDFRSAERTFQLLTQVAGRAGRGERRGRVLIQTRAPHHYSIRAARDQDYARFMRRELELRRELMYPPFARMALVRIEGEDSRAVGELAAKAAAALAGEAGAGTLRVLGPAPAPIERIKRRWRWQVAVKSAALAAMRNALVKMRAQLAPPAARDAVHVAIDVDPVNML